MPRYKDGDPYAESLGGEPPEVKNHDHRRNVYLGDTLVTRAMAYGRKNHLSLSAVIRLAIEEFLRKEGA